MAEKTQLPGQTGIVLMGSLPEFGELMVGFEAVFLAKSKTNS